MTTTAILELTKPAQGYANWHIPINANFDTLETKLVKAYQNVWVVGQITYFTSNAKYVTDHWERLSISYGATMFAQDNENKTIKQYYCASGSGAISWLALKIPNVDLTFTSAVNLNSNTLSNVGNVNTIGNVSNCGLINFKSTNKTVPIPDTGFGNVRKINTTSRSTNSAFPVTAYTFTVPSNYGDGSIAVRVSANAPGPYAAYINVSTTSGYNETRLLANSTTGSYVNIDFLGVAVAGGDTVTISFWREYDYTIYTNGYSVACFEGIPNTQTWS